MAKQSKIIVGQVAAITGGGRGIGKETPARLSREGVRVAIGDLDLEAAKRPPRRSAEARSRSS